MAFFKPNIKEFLSHLKKDFIEIKSDMIHFKNDINEFDFKLVSNKIKLLTEKIIINILKDFQKILTTRRILLNVILIIGLIYFEKPINQFLKNYLAYEGIFSSSFVFKLLIVSFLIISCVIIFKLLKNKYQPTLNEINAVGLTYFLLIYLKSDNWTYSSFSFLGSKIFYIDFILILLSLFLIINFIRYILVIATYQKLDKSKNIFLNDDPIFDDDDDRLQYLPIVDKLTEIILNENNEKSFAIGLVGPWGNGKSSVLSLVRQRIKNRYIGNFDTDNIVSFSFLPYLNHKEDDIINEFFTSLSNELVKYNGKLSNIISEYSSKITDLYQNKNVLGFIEDHVVNFKNSSANELYNSINEMLVETNKKIIVFVDDLDRLNKNEILQVLKLIRNTADFRNIIFIVAMDKEYVLKSLKKSKKIFHTSFIDKFFQLEIYLPEIDKTKLRENFILGLKSSTLNNGSPDFEFKILNAINNKQNLFDDYIKNLRDVKRLVNQVIYDYPNTGGEINWKDFLNFTYFKLKFPNFINILKQSIGNIIELDNDGKYKLKEKEEKEDNNQTSKESFRREKILDLLSKQHSFDPKKYELYNEDFFSNCLFEDQTIDCENRFLLIKTLAFLFGNENNVNDVSSIKDENNLRILLEQKVPKNRLLNLEFEFLLSSSLETIINTMEEFSRDKKIEQLLSRFKYFTASKNENEYKNAILALVYIFEKRKEFSIYEATIIDQIGVFAHKLNSKKDGLNIDLKDWSTENIFYNTIFNIETRTLLFGHLRNGALGNKFEVTRWGFEEKELNDTILKLFNKYIDHCASLISNPNDYSMYFVYHTIKSGIESDVRKIIIEFWRKSNLELLCSQITDLDTWSSLSFKISDVIIEFFESKLKFIQFVKSHKDSSKIEIKEFLELYKLLEISDFKYTCMFTFEKSKLMLKKIEHQKQFKSGRDENQELIQLVLETNSFDLIDSFRSHNEFDKKYGSRVHEKQNGSFRVFYLFVYLKESISKDPVLTYTQELYHTILPLTDWEKNSFVANNIVNGKNLIPQKNNDNYLKVISIEPRKKNNNINYEVY